MNHIWLSFLFCATYISGIIAQHSVIIMEGDPRNDPGSISIAVVLWIAGLMLLFFGKRNIKIILFIAGFVFFGACAIIIASKIVDVENITNDQRFGIIVGSVTFAVLGGILTFCLYKIGIIIGHGLEVSKLMISLMEITIVIVSSLVGSQLFMIGVDVLANKGYIKYFQAYSVFKSDQVTPVLWAMKSSSLIMTLIGILFQSKNYSKIYYCDNKGSYIYL